MTDIAGIWNLQRLGFAWRNEVERVTANFLVGNGFFDFRHMTGNALIAGASSLVVGMGLDACSMRSDLRVRAMAIEAQRVAGLADHGDILGPVRVMAGKAGDAAGIHQALREIVALHPVLVCGAVRKMGEGEVAELVFFQLPVVFEMFAHIKAHRPVSK